MWACKVTITTSADGQESTILRTGTIDISEERAFLSYREENAQVCITLQKGSAIIDRQGDYTLRLTLEQGKTLTGSVGLGGSEGSVSVRAHHVKYSLERNVFKLSLRYDLLFGEEVQKMRLKLRAQIKNEEGKR